MQRIAGGLKRSRQHVSSSIDAFAQDGFAGLEDKRQRPADHPSNQLTLPLMKDMLDMQREHPRAGRFRVRGFLGKRLGRKPPREATVGRAMAKNRTLLGAPGPWVTDNPADKDDGGIKETPDMPAYRHQ